MTTGFERVKKLAAASTLGSIGLLGMGSAARAASTILGVDIRITSNVIPGTRVEWSSIDNRTVDDTDVLTGLTTRQTVALGINDATIRGLSLSWSGTNYTGATYAGTATRTNVTLDDAFDDYGGLFLDGAAYNDADGRVDLTGTTMTTDPATMPNGLSVYAQYHAFTDKRVMRIIYAIHNPTSSAIFTQAAIGGNLGSDTDTYVAATSDGDRTVEPGDNWVITHDRGVFGGTASSDPILTHVAYGQGGSVTSTPLQIPGSGNGNISFAYNLRVNPGETQYITYFVEMSVTMSEALTNASRYTNYQTAAAAGLFDNLPAGMPLSANWQQLPGRAAASVPVGTPLGLAVLSGLVGFAAYRRKKKPAS